MSESYRRAALLLLQALWEQKVTDHLGGRAASEQITPKSPPATAPAMRPGSFRPPRVTARYPPPGAGYRPSLPDQEGAFFQGNSEVLVKLTAEMYASGLATPDSKTPSW